MQIVAMNGIGTLISTLISDSRINVIDINLTHYDDIKSSMRSRVVNIRSLRQFIDAISKEDSDEGDNDNNNNDRENFRKTATTERYTLIAFYDDSISDCSKQLLQHQILCPWPFAGLSSEGNTDGAMWWEEVMITTKINLNKVSRKFKRQLRKLFDFPEKISDFSCPCCIGTTY